MDINTSFSTSLNLTVDNQTYGDTEEDIGEGVQMSVIVIHYVFTIVVPVCFAILIAIGTFGNFLVMYVIITNKQMHTCTNIMLMNLAVADIAFLMICLPFQAYKFASMAWDFSDMLCKFVQYLLYVTCYVTIWTLVLIAIIRYYTVVWKKSLDSQRHGDTRIRRTIYCCAALWVLSSIGHVPTLLSHSVKTRGSYQYCGINIESLEPIIISFFVFAYVLPLLIITILYLRIVCFLRGVQLPSHRRHVVRAIRIISLVVVFFAISWLPYHLHAIVSLRVNIQWDYYLVCRVLWYIMAYGNSVVNPIIYNFTSGEFRSAFYKALCRFRAKYDERRLSRRDTGQAPETQVLNVVQL